MEENSANETVLDEEQNAQNSSDSSPAYSKSIDEVIKDLGTDGENGLSEEEAQRRLAKDGPNKLQEAKRTPFIIKLLKQFIEPMVIVLLIACVISFVIFLVKLFTEGSSDEWIDCIVILAIVIINAVIGAVEEQKAEDSLEALKKLSTPMCTVRRDGVNKTIKSEDVVVGDLIILEEGSIIPADCRLIKTVDMKSDESSLTGESVPAEKDASVILDPGTGTGDQANIGHMSCPISYGRGVGIVTATGMNTEVGKIATLLNDADDEQTPLQKKLAVLSKQLGLLCLIIVILTFVVGMVWAIIETATGTGDWGAFGWTLLDLFESAIALAVAAIPEGLPAIVTIALALGVGKMVKVNTIVRKLPSVETLGSATVICSDKTGTLTQNRMTVKKVYWNGVTYDADQVEGADLLVKGMALCCDASIEGDRYGDPTELALLDYALTFGWTQMECEAETPRINEHPFDSVRKMMSTEHSLDNGDRVLYVKGALDQILKITTRILVDGEERDITPEDIDEINEKASEMARGAFRVLAFAYRRTSDENEVLEEADLVYGGMVGMIDPEREEAKPAVAELRQAGIRTVMITGDHRDTAFAIAQNLGIAEDPSQCVSGDELNQMTEEELQERVKTANVFARVSPQNKVDIVKALKANGEIAAMTGDGVNDAPSLKAADIGIAMGITGTDVAKSAADMVLTDDNFASIEKAVEEGRGIYANVKKAILYLLSSNIAEVLIMFVCTLLGWPLPLATLHILWINLITDSLPAIALSMDAKEKDIMKQKPRDPNDGIFAHGALAFTLGYGVVIFVATLLAYLLPAFMHMGGLADGSWDWSWDGLINCLNSQNSAGQYVGVLYENGSYSTMIFETEAALNEAQFTTGYLSVHEQSQTFAFTVLAMAQVFHMVGMSDIKHSFINVFKGGNWMMLVSFIFGLGLQVLVTEVDGMAMVFGTTELQWNEWLYLLAIALLPLIVHEILAPIFRKKQVQII